MRPLTLHCPYCGANHEFFLRDGDERHLRQCPSCDGWFVYADATDDVETLGNPATCPVEGCTEAFDTDALVAHVIEVHGGTLDPE